MSGVRVQLIADLLPWWLRTGAPLRYQMGVSFLCPLDTCCRMEFWFVNPADGDLPRPDVELHFREGAALVELTLSPIRSWSSPLRFGHWTGYVRKGRVVTLTD